MEEDDDFESDPYETDIDFADPGGRSSLRAASVNNPRDLPCPTCGAENKLTPADVAQEPGEGADWFDYAPETGESARAKAQVLISTVEKQIKFGDIASWYDALASEGEHCKDPTPHGFGYCLAMEALGHGVGWADNHPDHRLNIPLITYSDCDV